MGGLVETFVSRDKIDVLLARREEVARVVDGGLIERRGCGNGLWHEVDNVDHEDVQASIEIKNREQVFRL